MKTKSASPRRVAVLGLRRRLFPVYLLPWAAALVSASAAHAQTATSAVPGLFNFQGKVANANGTLVGAGTPVNRTVVFRIWDHSSNSTTGNLVYSEQQTVTVTDGEFSVLIGQGSAVSGTPLGYSESTKGPPSVTIASAAVFGGATRYLGITIDDGNSGTTDPEITPRQQLVTSAYAFRAKYAESVGSNGASVLTVIDSGNVGIGAANPGAKLEVAGNIRAGGAGVANPSLQLLANHATNVASSIGYANSAGTLSTDAAAIDTVFRTENGGKLLLQTGAGASALVIDANNRVGIGTSAPNAALDVNGALMLKTTLTNASSRPAVGSSRVGAEIGGYGSGGAGNDDGFLRLSAGGGTTATAKSFIDVTGFSTVADMDKTLVFGTAGVERMRINNTGALLFKGGLTNASARPAVGASRLAAEIGGYGSGGVGNDDGFLRLSAGGGTNANSKSYIDLSGFSTAADMDRNLIFGTAGTERMRINVFGNVGIGTASPNAPLNVVAATNTYALTVGDGAREFGAFLSSGSNAVQIGSKSNHNLQFFTNNAVAAMTLTTDGRLGINTTSPASRLHVGAGVVIASYVEARGDIFGWADVGNAYYPSVDIGVIVDSSVRAGNFFVNSDARIKQVQGRSSGAEDLATLRKIEVTDYTYVDKLIHGRGAQKKAIAQQVEQVFPQAVTRAVGVVSDIFRKASTADGWVTLETDLKVGERVRLIADGRQDVHEVLEALPGRFRTAFKPKDESVFVYGREVKDFRSVDYEAISMLNVSATQELKRENDALRAANEALAARVADLEAKDRARDTKMAAIEKLLQANRTVMAAPAKTTNGTNGQE